MDPLPEFYCPSCNLVQIYRGQDRCIHRGCLWSNWFLANLRRAVYGSRYDPPLTAA